MRVVVVVDSLFIVAPIVNGNFSKAFDRVWHAGLIH